MVSKTDLMGAYYAGLPLSTACETVMMGPPLFCRAQDTLDLALDYHAGQQGAPSLRQGGWRQPGGGRPGLSGYRGSTLPVLQQMREEPEVEARCGQALYRTNFGFGK